MNYQKEKGKKNIALKTAEYLGMNLTKVVKYLCFQTYKTQMRKIEYDRKK